MPGHAERSEAAPQPLDARPEPTAPPRPTFALLQPFGPRSRPARVQPEPQSPFAATWCSPRDRAAPVRAHTRAVGRANSRWRKGCLLTAARWRTAAGLSPGVLAPRTCAPLPCSTGGARSAGPPAAGQQSERIALGAGARAPAEAVKRVPV